MKLRAFFVAISALSLFSLRGREKRERESNGDLKMHGVPFHHLISRIGSLIYQDRFFPPLSKNIIGVEVPRNCRCGQSDRNLVCTNFYCISLHLYIYFLLFEGIYLEILEIREKNVVQQPLQRIALQYTNKHARAHILLCVQSK